MENKFNGLKSEFQNLIELVSNVVEAFTSALFILEEDHLNLATFCTLSRYFLNPISIPVGHGMIGWVAKQGKPINISHFSQDAQKLKFYDRDEQIKSFLAVPVLQNGQAIGVLAVDSKNQYVFTEKVQKILGDFAAQFSLMIEKQREQRRFQHSLAQYEIFQETLLDLQGSRTISEIVHSIDSWLPKLIPYDVFLLAVPTPEDGRHQLVVPVRMGESIVLKTFPLPEGKGHLGKLIKSSQPMLLQNPKHLDFHQVAGIDFEYPRVSEFKSFLGVPLSTLNEHVGALALLGTEKNQFSKDHLPFLNLIGPAVSSLVLGAHYRSRLKTATLFDSISHSPNHRYVMERIQGFTRDEGRPHPYYSIIWLSIDNFSNMLDIYSIDSIDEFLVKFTQFLEKVIGDSGVVGKYYANQYIIFLPSTGETDSKAFGKRAYDLVKAKRFGVGKKNLEVRVKMGCATYPDDANSLEEVIKCSIKSLWKIWNDPDRWIGIHGEMFNRQRKISWL